MVAVAAVSDQMEAARGLLAWNQRTLVKATGVSLPTSQRMEANGQDSRCNVDTLVKVLEARGRGGNELIAEGAISGAGG